MLRKKAFLIISTFIFVLLNGTLWCQTTIEGWRKKYKTIEQELNNKKISEVRYLEKLDTLTNDLLLSGFRFSSSQQLELLTKFKEVAWSRDSFSLYRRIYYQYLINGAIANGRTGEAFFYAEKIEKEYKKLGKSIMTVPFLKIQFWVGSQNSTKAIELYKQQRPKFAQLLENTPNKSNIKEYLQTMLIYYTAIPVLCQNDKESAKEVADNSIILIANIKKKYPKKFNVSWCYSVLCNIHYYTESADFSKAQKLLDSLNYIINCDFEDLKMDKSLLTTAFLEHSFELNIKTNNNKKAAFFLNLLNKQNKIFADSESDYDKASAKYYANLEDYKNAYAYLDSTLQKRNREFAMVSEDMANLSYAYTEAEYRKLELQNAEAAKRKQVIWIIIISTATTIIILVLVRIIRGQRKESRIRIANLNKMADMAVVEAKKLATIEAQKSLGQDLHDDMSASLAGLLNKIETTFDRAENTPLLSTLQELYSRTNEIYSSVRQKSHLIYKTAIRSEYEHFRKSINNIANSALVENKYQKEIEIEETVALKLNTGQRIQLLRIIQEAMINIVKHAKATEVYISLYENAGSFVLQISDNGIGIKNHEFDRGMGIVSIKKRAVELKASIEFINEDGTTIIIVIPQS